jgi:hypothetical protein
MSLTVAKQMTVDKTILAFCLVHFNITVYLNVKVSALVIMALMLPWHFLCFYVLGKISKASNNFNKA